MRIICLMVWVLAAMVTSCAGKKDALAFPYGLMMEGDLAFRCGRGVFSRAVTTAEEEGVYSHVGVLILDSGVWKVAHAVPGEKEFKGDFDRVKIETLEKFYAPDRAFRGGLVHTGLMDAGKISDLHEKAVGMAADSVRFDGSYSLADSSEVYCTEFIWLLYNCAGIDLSQGRRRHIHALNINDDVILPEHLLQYSNNELYFSF